MPLVNGDSREAIGKNISILRGEGKPPKQAIAIALNMAGKSKTASVDELASAIAANPVKLALWETFKASLRSPAEGEKTAAEHLTKMASPWKAIAGGAALGGLGGAGVGALGAHMRGDDVGSAALKGGLGGAAGGAALGGLHAALPGMGEAFNAKIGPYLAEKGLGAAMLGGGAMAGNALGSAAFGSNIAKEQQEREVGKFDAQVMLAQRQRQQLAPLHDQAFQQALQDDTIQRAPQDIIHSAFETMKSFAPNLAADVNAARSFLRESAIYQAGPSYASIKNLADSEKSVVSAQKLAGANR